LKFCAKRGSSMLFRSSFQEKGGAKNPEGSNTTRGGR